MRSKDGDIISTPFGVPGEVLDPAKGRIVCDFCYTETPLPLLRQYRVSGFLIFVPGREIIYFEPGVWGACQGCFPYTELCDSENVAPLIEHIMNVDSRRSQREFTNELGLKVILESFYRNKRGLM